MNVVPITYTNYNGVEVTENFYFYISDTELTHMQLTTEGGLDERMDKIIKAKNDPEIMEMFKQIILMAYGERSDDGKYFVKKRNGVKLSEMFEQSAAFDKLYMKLFTDPKYAADFIKNCLSTNLQGEIAKHPEMIPDTSAVTE